MPASRSRAATASTFSSRGLVKTCLMVGPSSLRVQRSAGLVGRDHADQAFLRGAGDQAALTVEHLAAREAPRPLRARTVDRIQQPVVGAERAVEPERVV